MEQDLRKFQKETFETNSRNNKLIRIKQFLDNECMINNLIVKNVFSLIIKRKDNSLRFISYKGKSTPKYLLRSIDTLLELKPAYSGQVENQYGRINYDVVILGGKTNE